MAHSKAFSPRDRQEADLLLNVVLAHMAFSSAKDGPGRQVAHDRLVEAVRILYEFVAAKNVEVAT